MPNPTPAMGDAAERVLTQSQRFMLDWLLKEDWSSYGECRGSDLDRLLALGFAELAVGPLPVTDYTTVRATEGARWYRALLAERDRLGEALRPFALVVEEAIKLGGADRERWNREMPGHWPMQITITMDMGRNASASLSPRVEGGE